jgi:hypothetical protein
MATSALKFDTNGKRRNGKRRNDKRGNDKRGDDKNVSEKNVSEKNVSEKHEKTVTWFTFISKSERTQDGEMCSPYG